MPPNQFAQVMSRTPAVFLMVSPWLVGIEKISDVERMVTMRVDELAAAAALKPSRMARSDAKRNTAMATLNTVSAVRRLLRRALFRISPTNFISASAFSFQLCSQPSALTHHRSAFSSQLALNSQPQLSQRI